MEKREFLTVSEFNHLVRDVLSMGFPQPVWICGEIQGYDRNRSKKHVFFELCEKDPESKDITSRIGMVIFAGRREFINGLLKKAANAFDLKDDIEVKFLCRVDFYPPHGAVRLIVESIDPVYTLGRIAQEKQKLIARLTKQGILQKNKALPLPQVPLRIGLITAEDSAAYNDFLSELRQSGYAFQVLFSPALMQGKGAPAAVCKALRGLMPRKDLDVIVITRGGGSIADLSCFDSEVIASAVAGSPLPVLSGIGHEINITVTDLAAHTYQKTPTAIARFLVEQIGVFLSGIDDKARSLLDLTQEKIQHDRDHLKDMAIQMRRWTDFYFKNQTHLLRHKSDILQQQPTRVLGRAGQDLRQRYRIFIKNVHHNINNTKTRVENYARLLELADPARTIRRGFSITRRQDGRLVRQARDVHPGCGLVTVVADSLIRSQVQGIEEKGGQGGEDEIRPSRKKAG